MGRPTPRNESVASATIAPASAIVVMTMTGAIEFGTTWAHMILNRGTPIAVAAVTKSEFFTRRISDLSTRAVTGHANTPIASEMIHTLRYSAKTDMMTTAARM